MHASVVDKHLSDTLLNTLVKEFTVEGRFIPESIIDNLLVLLIVTFMK